MSRRLSLAAPVVAIALACVAVHERVVLREAPVPREVLSWAVALHRARIARSDVPPPPRSSALAWTPPAPVAASVFRKGRAVVRVAAKGPLGRALRETAAALAASGEDGTIRIDVPTARRPFVGLAWIDALSIAPVVDGLGAESAGRIDWVAPLDLLAMGAYERHWVQLDGDAGQTTTIAKARRALSKRPSKIDLRGARWFRLRVRSAVEGAPGRLARTPDERPTRETLRAATARGARYLVGQLRPDGRYRYAYDPLRDADAEKDYNVPRHCGTTYFLAQAAGYLEEPEFARGAKSALDHLRRSLVKRDPRTGTLVAGLSGRVDTGSAALAIVALTEYRHVTRDARYDRTIRGLAAFLLEMQRGDGDFHHRYRLANGERDTERLLYYAGESALALLKAHEELGDDEYLRAAERALDYLTIHGWRFFGAEYLPGEEHWTCIAANEAYPRIRKRRYLDFCRHWASLRRGLQLPPSFLGSGGGYADAPMLVPNTTPTGSTTEATISTALLARKWGTPDPEIERQSKRAASLLLRRQLDGAILHLFPDPDEARGGFPSSAANLDVRIDFVQHSASALVRLTDLL